MNGGNSPAGLDDHIYQRLLKERIVFLGSEVKDQNANAICAQMLLLNAEDPDSDIFLYINSPGGSVDAGMAIYDTMQFISNDVATVGMGLAASMGQFLLCAGAKDKRYALPARADHDAPAVGRHGRLGLRHQDPGRAVALHQEGAVRADRPAHRPRPRAGRARRRPRPLVHRRRRPSEYGFIDHVVANAAEVSPGGKRKSDAAPHDHPPSQSAPVPGGPAVNNVPLHQQTAPRAEYFIPQWEERTSYGVRRIDPFAKLFEDRIIFLGTPISDDIANAVMAQLLCLQSMDADRDISIYINSPGGSFTALTAIYDTMRYIKPDIQTVCLGQAASAAAVLLAAGTKGKRLALPEQPDPDPPAVHRGHLRPDQRHRDPGQRDPAHALAARADDLRTTPARPSKRSAATSSATRSSPLSRPSSTA